MGLAWAARALPQQCDGTFTDVTAKTGLADGRWSTGAAFGDYDGDGNADRQNS